LRGTGTIPRGQARTGGACPLDIKDLPAPRNVALPRQMAVELREQCLHQTRLRQRLAIKPDRLCVGHTVLQPKAEEPHERQPVAHLILDLVIRKVVERAQDQRLEHQNRIHRLAPRAGFPFPLRFAPHPFQHRPELLPRHDGVDLDQRIFLRIQARVTI
jgi:hypothetical protein